MSKNNEKNIAEKDTSFDNIANKFDKNIYGTTKGRLRHQLLLHYLSPIFDDLPEGAITLDAGGGTGEFSRELLKKNCEVLLNDLSQDTLDVASQKLQAFTNISYHCGPLQTIEPSQKFDFIACHAVLEWLEDPKSTVSHLIDLLNPGACLSLSFFNKDANLFGNMVYGNFELIKNDMKQKNRLRLASHSPLKPKDVINWIQESACSIENLAGIRCFHDYLQDKSQQESCFDDLLEMEKRYGHTAPFMWLGKYFHIIVRKS